MSHQDGDVAVRGLIKSRPIIAIILIRRDQFTRIERRRHVTAKQLLIVNGWRDGYQFCWKYIYKKKKINQTHFNYRRYFFTFSAIQKSVSWYVFLSNLCIYIVINSICRVLLKFHFLVTHQHETPQTTVYLHKSSMLGVMTRMLLYIIKCHRVRNSSKVFRKRSIKFNVSDPTISIRAEDSL